MYVCVCVHTYVYVCVYVVYMHICIYTHYCMYMHISKCAIVRDFRFVEIVTAGTTTTNVLIVTTRCAHLPGLEPHGNRSVGASTRKFYSAADRSRDYPRLSSLLFSPSLSLTFSLSPGTGTVYIATHLAPSPYWLLYLHCYCYRLPRGSSQGWKAMKCTLSIVGCAKWCSLKT